MMIMSQVDEAGLSPVEFRVLAHICRRSGDGECWAAVKTIAATCRINVKSARKALAQLERSGWIECRKRTGQTSVLIPKMGIATPTNPIPYPMQYPTQSDTHHPYQSDTGGSTQSDTPKGNPRRNPKKVTQIIKAQIKLPYDSKDFTDAWERWVRHNKIKRKPLPETTVELQLEDLARWGESRAIQSIMSSIKANWQALFEPKDQTHQGRTAHRHAGLNTIEITGNEF